jgi:cyclopropane-fatty-acyl-phospholipid synthase
VVSRGEAAGGTLSRLEDKILASGLMPDAVLRSVIRSRVKSLEERFDRLTAEEQAAREAAVVAGFESGPITVNADDANRQHYDLPPGFFEAVLGPRLKYSCCYWPEGVTNLAQAEEAMLELTAERAGLGDGQEILDLGCGWGSLALWAAQRYPGSRVLAVSNSNTQRRFIENQSEERGLSNLQVVTADVAGFDPPEQFNRVVSVEMLEHVRNHKALLERVASWLRPDGRLFVHIFCHRCHVYPFQPAGDGGWMAEHFFSGGVMPSWDYLTRCQDGLALVERWQVEGCHYARTLRAWLENLDRHRASVMPLLRATDGPDRARLWLAYWRVFFMACEETFALDRGRAYFVGHYLFRGEASRRR